MDLAVSEVALEDRRLFIGLVRDITERKAVERLQQELLSSGERTARTRYRSQHLCPTHAAGEAYLPSAVTAMIRESKRLARLIDDLLDVTRVEAGQLRCKWPPST